MVLADLIPWDEACGLYLKHFGISDTGQSENRGRVIFDASVGPQNIAFPTDLDLLSDAREKTEELIDKLYHPSLHEKKPRTYRQVARRRYLRTAKKKVKSNNEIRRSVGSQLRFIRRNLNSVNKLLDAIRFSR